MTVAPSTRQLPWVWSPWWWVFTNVRTGLSLTRATEARRARVRASVPQVSTSVTVSRPAMIPALLSHQLPSGWM